jgi:ABC-2 type transport system permease protein
MSTAASAATLDISQTRPIPFWRLVAVELRKTYDTRAGFWLLFTIGLLVALVEIALLVATLVQESYVAFSDFSIVAAFITSILLPVLGILVVTGEWGQRTAMVTFAIEPRRLLVVLAKLVVGLVLTLLTVVFVFLIGLVLITICEVVQPELTSWDYDWEFVIAFTVGQSMTMIVGFALAALLLNTPGAIVGFFVYWWGLSLILAAVAGFFPQFLDVIPWINLQVALAPFYEWELDRAEEVAQIFTSATLWIGIPLGLGLWRILTAEVK